MRALFTGLLGVVGSTLYAQQILVPPYLQPGNAPSLTKEEKVIIWQTDSVPAVYTVECSAIGTAGESKLMKSKVSATKLVSNNKTTWLYRSTLTKLDFDQRYTYKVIQNGKQIASNTFRTRSRKNETRFIAFGDCGARTPQQAKISWLVHQQNPDFVLVTGDNVYSYGTEREYRRNFFPYYLAEKADSTKGSPIMSSIPFYMIVGNHDVYSADFAKYPDGLAYFYYNDLPLNAPVSGTPLEAEGPDEVVKSFKKNMRPRFPGMTNFSFDHGNVHIVCLDANSYVNPLDPTILEWLTADLKNSKADWKIVTYHHPGFNSSKTHYDYQRMRLLSPVLEQLGVDMVLTGHVHNYQRTYPIKFAPKKSEDGTQYIVSENGQIDGQFTLDESFDGITNTRPKGIIYVVTGAGGAVLYDKEMSANPLMWKHEPQENWVPFTVKIISDIHSFTIIETKAKTLKLHQVDVNGNTIDEISVTK